MVTPAADKKPERATLLGSMNPWGARSTPPGPAAAADPAVASTAASAAAAAASGPTATALPTAAAGTSTTPDHSTSSYYGRSFRRYPAGCPPLKVQWFHAVDVPKRKANWINNKKQPQNAKPPPPPKKYIAFSADDNRSIEAAYQKELEGFEDRGTTLPSSRARGKSASEPGGGGAVGDLSDAAKATSRHRGSGVKVPVNEDFLFDVDIEDRELAPVYWLGPVYDVRRGSWFYQEGSSLRACEENLAAQLEEGYLKAKPWLYVARDKPEAVAKGGEAASSDSPTAAGGAGGAGSAVAAASLASAKSSEALPKTKAASTAAAAAFHPESHRLFGQYMNHVATYQDATTAFLSTDSMLSWVTSTMYEKFAGGGYMSGVKVVRGYSEPKKTKDDKDKAPKEATGAKAAADEAEEKRLRGLKRRSAPATTKPSGLDGRPSWDDGEDCQRMSGETRDGPSTEIERRGNQLQRQLSSLMGNTEGRDPALEEEEIRLREEQEIQDDYKAVKGETQGREIEHLVLVTHGIGQLLGLRMESLNFIHDVNMLRKTLKSVYAASPDLRALNSELPDGPGNCRIQVLPVCWRHLLDFPRRAKTKQEQDLSVIDNEDDEDAYPALEDITIEGMAFARSLISDLALDVLLYQSAYREQISEIVLKESNRIHQLFLDRNPEFKGTVHVVGHSLGSAIMFDILCRHREARETREKTSSLRGPPPRAWRSASSPPSRLQEEEEDYDDQDDLASPTDERPPGHAHRSRHAKELSFNFEVEDFYCLGSPIGLFQMLKGRTVAARRLTPQVMPPLPSAQAASSSSSSSASASASSAGDIGSSPFGFEYADDSFLAPPSTTKADQRVSPITGLPFSVSSPKVGQLFNIFHPSDPISYRIEPLISPAMKDLKPQPLPYTKKGLFGSVAPQGLTGIGAKVGQSVSGLWSSFSAGIASNLLNRSLGLSQEDVAKLEQQGMPGGSGGSGGGGGGGGTGHGTHNAPTVSANPMDEEVETLFAHFEKKRADMAKEDGTKGDASNRARAASWLREEAKAQRMRREEAKVRALNRNGRVDYCIQESVLDFNPMNTIASHMAYWADEDVSHFIMAQLFTGKKPAKK